MARRRALAVAILLLSYGAVGARQPAVRAALPLPVPATSLAAAVGLHSSDPSTLLLHIIRVVYEYPDGQGADGGKPRAALRQVLAAADPKATDVVPLPLDPSIWRETILERQVSDRDLVAAILNDRRIGLLYHGLSALDDETLAWLGPDRETLQLLREHAAVFATFGRAVHVRAGRVMVPGGAGAEPAWEALVGVSPSKPAAFVQRLFRDDGGRLPFLYDTVAHLDGPHQRFALGLQLPGSSRDDRLRALLDAFAEGLWRPSDRPFSRPMLDASLMLPALAVDERGQLAGPMGRRIWERVFRDDEQVDLSFSGVESREPSDTDAVADVPVDAAWLATRITRVPYTLGRRRLDTVLFAQRMFAGIDAPDPATAGVRGFEAAVATALRGYEAFPALMLALERNGVTEPSVLIRAAQRAHALDAVKSESARRTAVVQFQSALGIVERARRAGAVSPITARALASSLCGIEVSVEKGYEGRLARWFRGTLLLTLRSVSAAEASDPAEATVLAAMAGADRVAHAATIEWEGSRYRVDPSGAELRRLRRVREQQGGLSIDAALAAAAGQGIAAPATGGRADASKRATAAAAADRAVADTLSSVLYAAYLGDPDGQAVTSGNVALRHDLGFAISPGGPRGAAAWRLPVEDFGTKIGWRVRGSLLGLEAALSRLALRRLDPTAMPPAPKLAPHERQLVALNVALLNPIAVSDTARDEIAAALARGRARASAMTGDPAQIDKIAREAGLSEWRRQALAWTLEHDRARAASQLSLLELFWLGVPKPSAVDSLDAWGAATLPLSGCLCLAMPRPRPWEDMMGRPATGLLATRAADVALQVADILASLGLPASLAPGVLAFAMQDVADQAQPAYFGDWDEFGRAALALSRDRIADYVAALTANGPLVPAADTADRIARR